MNTRHPIGDPGELAALYLAGALSQQETAQFEAHLESGCAACNEELRRLDGAAATLLNGVTPLEPPKHIREQLLERARTEPKEPAAAGRSPVQVWRRWESNAEGTDLFIRRSDEGDWEETGVDGVRVRRLYVDRRRNQMTALVRMSAGASYPRHIHNGAEECLVLEGDLFVGDTELRAGDYQFAPVGSRHGIQRTTGGCLLLIVSSLSDEIL